MVGFTQLLSDMGPWLGCLIGFVLLMCVFESTVLSTTPRHPKGLFLGGGEVPRIRPVELQLIMQSQRTVIDGRKANYREKSCHSSTFSTTNLTWTDLGSNPGLRNDRSVTDPPETLL